MNTTAASAAETDPSTKGATAGLLQHPLSAAFPAMSPDDFDSLRASVAEVGILNPITLLDGMVIDGWHRYTIAQELGAHCPMTELDAGVDPRVFVLAQNKARRHITQAQLAMATAEVFGWRDGGRPNNSAGTAEFSTKSAAQIAEAAGTGTRTIEQAKKVLRDGVPEVKQAVKSGAIGLEKAVAIAKLPTDQQAAAIAKPAPKRPAPTPKVEPTEAAHAEPFNTPAVLALNTPAAVDTPPAPLPSASAPVDPAGPADTPSSASEPAPALTPGAVLAQIHAAFVDGLKNSLHATPVQSDPKTGRELVALSTVLVPGRDEISDKGLGAVGWIAAELNAMPWVDKFPFVVSVDAEPVDGERGVRTVANTSQHDCRIAARALQAAYMAGEDPLQVLDMLLPGIEADAPRARAVIGYLRHILSAHITLAMDGPAPVGDKDAEIRRLNFALVDEIDRANIWRLEVAETSAALVACHASLKRLGRKLK